MKTALVVALLAGLPRLGAAQTESDQTAVVAVVQRFFDAMAARDAQKAAAVLVLEGRFFSVREDGSVRSTTIKEYVERLPSGKEQLLERMWNPVVHVRGGIAVVWTPYDFYRDGTFSHCGIDAFDLVKMPDGWKIGGALFTIEKTNCPPSPLGPPK